MTRWIITILLGLGLGGAAANFTALEEGGLPVVLQGAAFGALLIVTVWRAVLTIDLNRNKVPDVKEKWPRFAEIMVTVVIPLLVALLTGLGVSVAASGSGGEGEGTGDVPRPPPAAVEGFDEGSGFDTNPPPLGAE